MRKLNLKCIQNTLLRINKKWQNMHKIRWYEINRQQLIDHYWKFYFRYDNSD